MRRCYATVRTRGMNKLEGRYEKYLELERRAGLILGFAFQPEGLRLADKTFYYPDFRVITADGVVQFHEVKPTRRSGSPYTTDDALVKIKVATELHPYTFVIAWPALKGDQWIRKEI